MTDNANALPIQDAVAELRDLVSCRCNDAYTGRGLHDPDCQCDSKDAVKAVTDRIDALEKALREIRDKHHISSAKGIVRAALGEDTA